ncbi:MAG TPA: hypothetical protein VFL77_04150 [Solirubrobacterales bacterium]|nr:hypothetical protein [Solirubrobacterales bacterium]
MIKLLTAALACTMACAALTADADAAAPGRGLLKGRTGQGRTIRLALHRHSVQIKRFTIELRCRDGSILIDDESGFLPTPLSASGRIRDHQIGSTDDVWIRGRLGGNHLRGSVRVRDRVGGVRCDSRWVRFNTRLRG